MRRADLTRSQSVHIDLADAGTATALIPQLARLLRSCVAAGASVSFVEPFTEAEAAAFWTAKVVPAIETGVSELVMARRGREVLGTVQLDLDTPPNQPHRAEVRKLLVHPAARRQGLARRLMAALENRARARGRWLITLDTRSDDAAEPLYRSLGYTTIGRIPNFSRDPHDPETLDATTIMYKRLGPP